MLYLGPTEQLEKPIIVGFAAKERRFDCLIFPLVSMQKLIVTKGNEVSIATYVHRSPRVKEVLKCLIIVGL